MRRTLTSLAILAATSLPALAQGDTGADTALAEADRLVRSVTLEDLKAVLAIDGYTINNTGDYGAHSVQGVTEGGLIFDVVGTICQNEIRPGCLGINMTVRYDGDEHVTLERVNGANLTWPPTSVWYDVSEPTLGVTRYVILDGGMTIQNVRDNLVNLLSIAPQVADYVWQTGVYDPDYDDDWDNW